MKPELLDLEMLVQARKLIERKENWIKRQAWVRGRGFNQICELEDATRFCSYGALSRVYGGAEKALRSKAWVLLTEATAERNCSPTSFNDNHTHEEVLAMWDQVIEKAKQLAS